LPSFGPSMAFQVDLTLRAQQDLDRIYSGVMREARYGSLPWCERFEQSILSLSRFPERCPVERSSPLPGGSFGSCFLENGGMCTASTTRSSATW
jgi:plasmid stabilization system protein ParE